MRNSSKFFDSSLDIKNTILEVEKVGTISEADIVKMFHLFDFYGFAVLQCKDLKNQSDDLLLLSKLFGNVTKHNRADNRGVVPITNLPGHSEYLGASNERHPLHTDSPFAKTPPKVMALQCEVPDTEDGFTNLVSCNAIYQYLEKYDPEGLKLLFRSDIFTVKRDNQSATRAIFESRSGRISMAFRTNDSFAEVSIIQEAKDTMDLIISFINNIRNQLTFKLERGQILITDNLSILHGRTGFRKNSPRYLNRVNFDGQLEYDPRISFGFEPVIYE